MFQILTQITTCCLWIGKKIWRAGDDFLLSTLPCAFSWHTAKPNAAAPRPSYTEKKIIALPCPKKKTHGELLLRRVPNRKHTVKLDFAVCH